MTDINISITLLLLNDLLRTNAIDHDIYSKATAKINAGKHTDTKQSLSDAKHLPETA